MAVEMAAHQDGLSMISEILGVQHGLEVIERKAIDHVVVLVGRAKAHDQGCRAAAPR